MSLIVANWKMNGSLQLCKEFSALLLEKKINNEVIICPPYTLLYLCRSIFEDSIQIGAQNCYYEEEGAYTGEVSVNSILEVGCKYCIIGHSERRQIFNESSQLVYKKAQKLLSRSITPIICVGENKEERNAGIAVEVILKQITDSVPYINKCIIAYEPIWAIGTGAKVSIDDISDVHASIYNYCKDNNQNVKILYGGSVNPDNIHDISKVKYNSGVLVGGKSLDVNSFWQIINNYKKTVV